jgi:hypothetical protein
MNAISFVLCLSLYATIPILFSASAYHYRALTADGSRFAARRPTFSTDHLKATDGNHYFAVQCVRPLKSLSASFQVLRSCRHIFTFCKQCSHPLRALSK